jgi:hypothetical protein
LDCGYRGSYNRNHVSTAVVTLCCHLEQIN